VTSDPPVVCDAYHAGVRVVRVRKGEISHRWVPLSLEPETLEELFEDDDDDVGHELSSRGSGARSIGRKSMPDARHSLGLVLGLPKQIGRKDSISSEGVY